MLPRKLKPRKDMNKAFKSCRRSAGKSGSVFVFFIDADGLKQVNDTQGHLAGDRVILDIACAIKNSIRKTDRLIRFGGDEFVVFMPSMSPSDAENVANRIHNNLDANVSVSIGVEKYDPKKHKSLDDIIHAADILMYTAKRNKTKTETGWEAA